MGQHLLRFADKYIYKRLCLCTCVFAKIDPAPTELLSPDNTRQQETSTTLTPALIDYQANNTTIIELSGTTSICFFRYDFELQQADCLS